MSKYDSIPPEHRELTRFDVAMDGKDGAATATIRQVVLSVKEEFYTVEAEINPCLDSADRSCILQDRAEDATHYLLDELRKYIKHERKEVGRNKYQVTAQIHLPYVRDEVVAGLNTELKNRASTITRLRMQSYNQRDSLLVLESLWFVRLYTWWKGL